MALTPSHVHRTEKEYPTASREAMHDGKVACADPTLRPNCTEWVPVDRSWAQESKHLIDICRNGSINSGGEVPKSRKLFDPTTSKPPIRPIRIPIVGPDPRSLDIKLSKGLTHTFPKVTLSEAPCLKGVFFLSPQLSVDCARPDQATQSYCKPP
eukprot:1159610-Pelagomonas_calceolata.AAC.2